MKIELKAGNGSLEHRRSEIWLHIARRSGVLSDRACGRSLTSGPISRLIDDSPRERSIILQRLPTVLLSTSRKDKQQHSDEAKMHLTSLLLTITPILALPHTGRFTLFPKPTCVTQTNTNQQPPIPQPNLSRSTTTHLAIPRKENHSRPSAPNATTKPSKTPSVKDPSSSRLHHH